MTPEKIIRPFRVEVPQERLNDIRRRVRNYRWEAIVAPADPDDWRYGPPPVYLQKLCAYWADGYDWRVPERAMNAVSQFATQVDGLDLHFVHEIGSGPVPRPLLIMHGWPYSFHSYTHLVERLAHPERFGGNVEDAFSVVIPSFPGYAFSGRPAAPIGPRAIATLFDKLMCETLGYSRYLAHGGDWGAITADSLGFFHADHVQGVHLTTIIIRASGARPMSGETPSNAGPIEQAWAASEAAIWNNEGGYSRIQSTRPMNSLTAWPIVQLA